MNEIESTGLLRTLADIDEAPIGDMPSDDQLRRYRAGALSLSEEEDVERALASSSAARMRLAALGGMAMATPSSAVRERVLAALPAPRVVPRQTPRRAWWQAAAAAAAVVLGVGYCSLPTTPLPEALEYVVEAHGLASSRGSVMAKGDTVVEATLETVVRLTMTAADAGAPGVAYALYRRVAGSLERVAAHPELRVEKGPGGATFEAPAELLIGSKPGTYEIFAVAARRGDLPGRLELEPDQDPLTALTDGRRRRANSVRIVLRGQMPETR